MSVFEVLLLALGLSMDAFAVSVCKGLSVKKAGLRECAICGSWFGGFQAVMPVAGFFLGAAFLDKIQAVDHWVAFGLLAVVGINMLKEAMDQKAAPEEENGDLSAKEMLLLAVATSIDALAVGISLAMVGSVNIVTSAILIGAVTFGLSALGVKLGNHFGNRFQKKAQITGGIILILLGTKILMEHLGILP